MPVLSNDTFFEEVSSSVYQGKAVRIKAKGFSMQPFIRDGKDELILKHVEGQVEKGMILLVRLANANHVVHRVAAVEKGRIILRGDGNARGTETCMVSDVRAKVATVVREGHSIPEGSRTWNLYRKLWPRHYLPRKILLAIYRRVF